MNITVACLYSYNGSAVLRTEYDKLHLKTQLSASAETEINMVSSFCFNLYTQGFEFLILVSNRKGTNDITKFETPLLDKDETDYLTAVQRQLRKTLTKHTRKIVT
jgi:hypothetical protein